MMKGDKSLDMVMSLVILLIVAAVVIGLVWMYLVNPPIPDPSEDCMLIKTQFKNDCKRLCAEFQSTGNSINAKQFCEKSMQLDLDCDKYITKADAEAGYALEVCESNVYCFMIEECKWANGELGWKECQTTVCDEYAKIHADPDSVNAAVLESIYTSEDSKCRLPEDEQLNWFMRFYGETPCSQ